MQTKSVNSDIAYDYIRKRILSGEFPPAHPLMTKALSDEIGVSRTPVRDALRQLEADGLVTIEARLGASVKKMELKEFQELCGMRLALESYAAGLAARHHSSFDLQEILLPLERMRQLTEQIVTEGHSDQVFAALVREDVRFHVAIMTAAQNELMKREILRLHLINRVVSDKPSGQEPLPEDEQGERRRAVLASHEKIFDAIKRRAVQEAEAEMEEHLREMVDHHVRLMARASARTRGPELSEEELLYTT
ncbi:GntR family transcriptional regulator [Actomonas aquatica]|uniref:GntR family transcriptional regulator n=1 Tax=Actomonas aquatica TaxID=2866162 RepID=A0ABZ1C2J6_9BACT|nr:GntR family transcriptional regulator [Opitutus sp. WL0086]WRQ85517.1 GntR family transcriptional regulator [Opitutus sp. WL0086]